MSPESFVIREAVAADMPALAQLHVDTFIETHGGPGLTYQVREWQWREAFAQTTPDWFCYVITSGAGPLIGFAKGVPYTGTISDYAGELNKIYLLRKYHRRGLGRRLIGHVSVIRRNPFWRIHWVLHRVSIPEFKFNLGIDARFALSQRKPNLRRAAG